MVRKPNIQDIEQAGSIDVDAEMKSGIKDTQARNERVKEGRVFPAGLTYAGHHLNKNDENKRNLLNIYI